MSGPGEPGGSTGGASPASDDPSDPDREVWATSNAQSVRELGQFTIKSLLTLNSGGAVALLTFIGTGSETELFEISVAAIQRAMSAFAVGICFAVLLLLVAYARNFLLISEAPRPRRSVAALAFYMAFASASLSSFCYAVLSVAFSIA